METKKLALVVTVLLLAAAAFVSVSEYVKTINVPAGSPQVIVSAVAAIQIFFGSTGVAMVVVIVRNVYGYAAAYYKAKFSGDEITYSTDKVGQTIAIITPIVNILAPAIDILVPKLGAAVAGAVAFIISLIISETAKLKT